MQRYIDRCDNAAEFVQTSANETMLDLRPDILDELSAEPPPSSGHHGWTSDAQRRYVMMMIRRGAIRIPYQRSKTKGEGVSASWDVALTAVEGGISKFVISNTSPAYRYVEGYDQQFWLARIGWLYAPGVLRIWKQKIVEAIKTDLGLVWRSKRIL